MPKGTAKKAQDDGIEMDSLIHSDPSEDNAQVALIQADEMNADMSVFNEGNIKIAKEKSAENEKKLTIGCSLKDINDKYGVGVSLYFDSIKCLIIMNILIFIPRNNNII